MNSSEGQEALESMVGQMLVAKLKKLGAQEYKVDQIVASLSFEDIRKCLPLTDDDLKKAFAKLFA
ncbi:MAG: phosphoribosyl-ATP pyrophosphatase [Kingella oralis]